MNHRLNESNECDLQNAKVGLYETCKYIGKVMFEHIYLYAGYF